MSSSSTTPIELTLKSGEVIKAATPEEALKIAIKMAEDTKEAYRTEKEQREALAAQVAQLGEQVQQVSRKPAEPGAFNKEQYWKLMNEDPVTAQNYLDAFRFGISDPSQVPQTFVNMNESISRFEGEAVAAAFLQQHYEDFPGGIDAAKSLRMRVEELGKQGYPMRLDTLNMAYSQLVSEGSIKPLEKKEREEREEPPPALRGAGQHDVPQAELDKAENMSTQELEKFLRTKGMIA